MSKALTSPGVEEGMDHLFKTRAEAVTAALEWARSHGDRNLPVPADDPIHAMWGVKVIDFDAKVPLSSTRWTLKSEHFLYPRFERPLEAVIKNVTAPAFVQTMVTAKEGLFATADDAERGLFRTCNYDLERGMSFVSSTPMIEVADWIGPEKKIFSERGWNQGVARRAIGGFKEALEAEEASLRELLNPFLVDRGYVLNRHSVLCGL